MPLIAYPKEVKKARGIESGMHKIRMRLIRDAVRFTNRRKLPGAQTQLVVSHGNEDELHPTWPSYNDVY